MIAGSLFSGIEGFGLGLLWSGLITSIAFQVEMDPFCQRVLAARFTDVDRTIQDVRLASAQSLPRVDLLFGGPPCQDVSGAGKGVGLTGARSGLVAEMLRLADELRPRVVLVENVASGARRWVCPVRGSLEALGYRTSAYHIGVDDCGGPLRRKRIFILAYANELQRGARAGVDQARHSSARPVPERSEVLACTERDAVRLDEQREAARRAPGEVRDGGDTEPRGRCEALADADGIRESQREGRVAGERGRPRHGRQEVAHAERRRRNERAGLREERAGLPEPAHGDSMADTASPRREGALSPDQRREGRGGAPERAGMHDARTAIIGVGGLPHGIPDRVARWPAGPGEEQFDWEPPRTVDPLPKGYGQGLEGPEVKAFLQGRRDRAAKLRALGNAVSPIQAYHVGLWARSILEGAS